MCFGGGDGATKRAEQAEAARTQRTEGNVQDINTAYANRQPQYDALGKSLRGYYGQYLDRERGNAQRKTKFGLARAGLTGGSAAVDANRTLGRESDEAVLNAERVARKGVADLQSQDEASKLSLISLAQNGADIGSAAQRAGESLRSNLAGAQSANNVSALGDVFGSTAAAYRAREDAAARRRGLKEASENVYSSAFSRG